MRILDKVKMLVAGLAVMAMGAFALPAQAVVYCPNGEVAGGEGLEGCAGLDSENNQNNLLGTMTTIINWIVGLVGFVAVVVIIFGGVQYTTSAGDAGKVKKAKDTIMYGIIGLVIALLAFAIVNFVLSSIMRD